MSLKKTLLVICKVLRAFVNTFRVDDKYSLLNRDNLTQGIQTQLSQKKNIYFRQFFSAFLKSRLRFVHFRMKDDTDSSCISEISYSEKRGELNV